MLHTSALGMTFYPASDKNLEIWLAETTTICSDIMLLHKPNISNIPLPLD